MTERASFFVGLADVPKLRGAISRLAGVGYAESLVKERLGLEDLAELQWRCLPIYRSERLASRDPLALAIDLFLLQGTLAVGELEARVLSSDLPPRTEATLLGQALKIGHQLDPIERQILDRIDGRIPVPDLSRIFRDLDVDEPTVIAAIRSLLRRLLLRMDGQFDES
jgi:hypothetical protein